jgi:hypothetical protein
MLSAIERSHSSFAPLKIFWKYIQSKTNTKENIPCIMDENAELLNNFFKSVFTTDSTQGIPPFSTTTIHNLEIVKFDSKNIQEHLEKLKETKSLYLPTSNCLVLTGFH